MSVLVELLFCRVKAEVRHSFITTTVREQIPGHTTRAPVGFELATNCIQFYAIANLDKTSLPFTGQYRISLGRSYPMSAPFGYFEGYVDELMVVDRIMLGSLEVPCSAVPETILCYFWNDYRQQVSFRQDVLVKLPSLGLSQAV